MNEAAEEAEVKSVAAKASDFISSAETPSTATAASTSAYAFVKDPTSTSSVVGVSRRSGYTSIIIMI